MPSRCKACCLVAKHHNETSYLEFFGETFCYKGFSFTLRRIMKYTVQNVKALTPKELIDILCKSAKLYSEYADTTLLFLFREKKMDLYDYYEVRFGRNNFMHLAGIKSVKLSAIEFYEACLSGTIKREDCNPRRDAKTMYEKVSVMAKILDLRNSKCYKIGKKNLVTRDNDFEMATGNNQGVVGYDSRIKMTGTSKPNRLKAPIPTTLLNNSITDYCSKPHKIILFCKNRMKRIHIESYFTKSRRGCLS